MHSGPYDEWKSRRLSSLLINISTAFDHLLPKAPVLTRFHIPTPMGHPLWVFSSSLAARWTYLWSFRHFLLSYAISSVHQSTQGLFLFSLVFLGITTQQTLYIKCITDSISLSAIPLLAGSKERGFKFSRPPYILVWNNFLSILPVFDKVGHWIFLTWSLLFNHTKYLPITCPSCNYYIFFFSSLPTSLHFSIPSPFSSSLPVYVLSSGHILPLVMCFCFFGFW